MPFGLWALGLLTTRAHEVGGAQRRSRRRCLTAYRFYFYFQSGGPRPPQSTARGGAGGGRAPTHSSHPEINETLGPLSRGESFGPLVCNPQKRRGQHPPSSSHMSLPLELPPGPHCFHRQERECDKRHSPSHAPPTATRPAAACALRVLPVLREPLAQTLLLGD